MSTQKLMNPREAALLIGRSHEWVYTQIRRGLLPFVTVDRIGLSVAPAIRLEEQVVTSLAARLRRVDERKAERRVVRARQKAERPPTSGPRKRGRPPKVRVGPVT